MICTFVLIVCFQFTEGTYSFKVKVNVHSSCFHELWFSRIYLFAVFTYKVRHRSGSRAHWKKILNFVQFSFRFSPFKIKLTLPASASLSKHKRIKCYPKNCKHVYKIGTIVVKKKRTIKSCARFLIVQFWTELQAKRLCNKL